MKRDNTPPSAMALGFFDGEHLGIQKEILAEKKEAEKEGFKSAVMSFDPHPSVVLGKSVQHVQYITPLNEKVKLISSLGIDYFFIIRFTEEFSTLFPQEFVDHYLIDLNVRHVVAGFFFFYSRMGERKKEKMPLHFRQKINFFFFLKVKILSEKNNFFIY